MPPLHLLLIEDERTRKDREKALSGKRSDRPLYSLNHILLRLEDSLRLSSVLVSDLPPQIPKDVDILFVHVDSTFLDPQITAWLGQVAGELPVVNGKLVDISKRTLDAHRPPGTTSLLVPADMKSGPVFIKSNKNARGFYQKADLKDVDASLRKEAQQVESNIVIQRWLQDYRTEGSGFYIVERYNYIFGEITCQEVISDQPAVKGPTPLRTRLRPRSKIWDDIAILKRDQNIAGTVPLYWLDDPAYWEVRMALINHYVDRLHVDFASFDAIQIAPNSIVVIDINKTPYGTGVPMELLLLFSSNFLQGLLQRVRQQCGSPPSGQNSPLDAEG